MLINEIINLLDVDELRNLVCHQRDLIDCLNEELYCKNRELDTLLYTYDNCRCGILDHENRIRQRQELDHVERAAYEHQLLYVKSRGEKNLCKLYSRLRRGTFQY